MYKYPLTVITAANVTTIFILLESIFTEHETLNSGTCWSYNQNIIIQNLLHHTQGHSSSTAHFYDSTDGISRMRKACTSKAYTKVQNTYLGAFHLDVKSALNWWEPVNKRISTQFKQNISHF